MDNWCIHIFDCTCIISTIVEIIHVQSKMKPANCKSIYRGCTNNTVPHL